MARSSTFAELSAVLVSAAAVITTIFGLFNSVLKDLMPVVEGAAQAVNVVAFGTLVVLLALVLSGCRLLGGLDVRVPALQRPGA
jgi:hypothetical protein